MSQNIIKQEGIPSGFPSLDNITGGWQKANLIVIASRPSVGKTAFATNIACNAAIRQRIPVAFFSLEMSSTQLGKRLIVQETGESNQFVMENLNYDTTDWPKMEGRLKELSNAPLFIDDTPGLSIKDFQETAKKLVEKKGVKLLVVDYLQLMTGPEEYRGQREQEVAFVARALKSTAKELNVPVIALTQLSRAANSGSERPELRNIRESGTIEEAADLVIIIHRPDIVSIIENPADKENAELIIGKNRNGKTCSVSFRFTSENLRFSESEDSIIKQERPKNVSKIKIRRRLNEQYTLDTFKLTPCNIEAFKVAMDFVCNLPNSRQFLLIGPTGSGKTRLINVVGNAIDSDMTVLYVTGEEFENQYLDAVKTGRKIDFMNFYLKADVMLLDGLQEMNVAGAREALYHISTDLDLGGKRLGVTSSLNLNELEKLYNDERAFMDIRKGRVVEIGKFEQ